MKAHQMSAVAASHVIRRLPQGARYILLRPNSLKWPETDLTELLDNLARKGAARWRRNGALMVANANEMSGGGDGNGSNGQPQSEKTDAPTRPTREQALKDVYAEADKKGVKILTDADPEIKAYMDNAGARQGTEVHAITLGDDTIVVREEYANNVRVLREELIHTQQQTSGFPIDSSGDLTTQMELDARRQLLDNKDSWALTDDEVKEVQSEISTILQRGRY